MLNNSGFNILIILFMLIALGLVGSLVLLNQTSSESNRRLDETVKKMDLLLDAIADYEADNTAIYPTTLADLTSDVSGRGACTADPITTSKLNGWCGPYIDNVFQEDASDLTTDGWGTAFFYSTGPNVLRSWGPNKTDDAGGGDDITRTF